MSLFEEVREALNRASRENLSDTADYILAEFLLNCLDAYEQATRERDRVRNLSDEMEGE